MRKFFSLLFLASLSKAEPDGRKLKNLINCFAWYLPNASHRPDNSKTSGANEADILYCRTDSGHDDHFCKFDGTNNLKSEYKVSPEFWYNCQMESCNAWDVPHSTEQRKCIDELHQ